MKTFIFPEMLGVALPEINWQASAEELKEMLRRNADKPYSDLIKKELLVQSRINASVGRSGDSSRLFKAYGELYTKRLPEDLVSKKSIVEIVRVSDNADQTVEFTLPQEQNVRVFAIGEGQGGEMFDYGWIESAETGKRVWEMKQPETKHAGGAPKNRLVDLVVMLPAGRYKLRYKADDSHSFDNWNAIPPDVNFWGIAIYSK